MLLVIAEYADVKTMQILTSVHPAKLSYNTSYDSLAANRSLLEKRTDFTDELGETFDALVVAAKAGLEELKSPDSILESGFFSSARSSFHSELASAVLKLQSVNVSPTLSHNFDMEKWQDLETFYSPISGIEPFGNRVTEGGLLHCE